MLQVFFNYFNFCTHKMLQQRYLVMSLKKLDHFLHMIPIESLYHVPRTFIRETQKN